MTVRSPSPASPAVGGSASRRSRSTPRRGGSTWSLRLPLRFLAARYGRLMLTVVALASGVALVCAIDLVNRAVARAFAEVVDTMAGRAALQVETGGTGFFAEELAEQLAAVPGVELAVPVVSATTFVADGNGELLTVHGVDIANEAAIRVYEARDQGGLEIDEPLAFLNQADSVVLTRSFGERHGLGVGSSIDLETPKGRRTFVARGLLEPHGVARVYGGNLVVMDLYAAEEWFSRPGFINRIDVVVQRSASVAEVARELRARLPPGLRVEAPSQRKADLQKVMQSLQVLLQGAGLVALVAAFLIAFNRLSTVFEERIGELAILRAAGVRARTVWWELLKESLLVGSAGVAVGVPLGVGLGRVILPIIATTTALSYKLIAPQAELSLRPYSLALAMGLGLSAAFLAALLPARRAARVTVAETLRGRGVEQQDRATGLGWTVRALVLAATVVALCVQAVSRQPQWGLLATGLIAVGAAMLARPLVGFGLAPAAALAARLGPSARLAASIMAVAPRRAGLMVAMFGVGLGSVLWLQTIAHSFERSALDVFRQAMRGDLVISSSHVTSGYLEMPVDETLASRLAEIPGVREVTSVRVTDWQLGNGPVAIDAFDPAYFRDSSGGQWPLYGRRLGAVWDQVADGKAVVVSSNFVLNLGVGVGDTVVLDTPTGKLLVLIAGVTADFASPRGTIEMSRDLYRKHWQDPQVTRMFVRLSEGVDRAGVRSAIAAALGHRYDLRILSTGELLEYFGAQVRRAFAPVDVLAAMCLLVILLGMADNLAAAVSGRARELAVVRAVGIRRRRLYRLVLFEALLTCALGLILALAVGLVLGALWVETTFPYLLGWVLELHPPLLRMAISSLLVVGICAVAALTPARRASRLEPARALRME